MLKNPLIFQKCIIMCLYLLTIGWRMVFQALMLKLLSVSSGLQFIAHKTHSRLKWFFVLCKIVFCNCVTIPDHMTIKVSSSMSYCPLNDLATLCDNWYIWFTWIFYNLRQLCHEGLVSLTGIHRKRRLWLSLLIHHCWFHTFQSTV